MSSLKPPTAPRSNALAVLVALGLAGSVHTAKAEDVTDLASLSGTWSYTGSLAGGDSDCDKTKAFQWILAVQPDGSTVVTVQGETSYPKLTGRFHGDAVSFSGVLDALRRSEDFPGVNTRSHTELTGSGTTFSGTATATFFKAATDGSAYPASCTYAVKGRRL
jgi:hypothetical protein